MDEESSLKPTLVAMDLEGVLVPEIWIAVAEKTGIADLRLTTRDISDYDQLMRNRIRLLREHQLTLKDIQGVIGSMEPLPGATQYLAWLRDRAPFIILTDSYYEFISPLRPKLGYPTLFCNSLEVDAENNLSGYRLRQKDGKKAATIAFKGLGFRVITIGDSYNDTTMLLEADAGILFRPPEKVMLEFPQLPVEMEYKPLQDRLEKLFCEPSMTG
jgi:phosphoserine / homoserine phosphotransferase